MEDEEIILWKSCGRKNTHKKMQRLASFKRDWIFELRERYQVSENKNGSFAIDTNKFGVLDFYPKANRLLFRRKAKWENNGLQWLLEHILN